MCSSDLAIRAEDKGFATLHFGEDLTHGDLKAAKAAVERNPQVKKIFEAARAEYNQYNKDMMNFLAQTGAISKETAANLTKNNDYIPWYRERNGVAELVIGGESPIKIGNIKEQPYLQELVGGDRPILDFMTSSVQNTNMLVDMGLRNLTTKETAFALREAGLLQNLAGKDKEPKYFGPSKRRPAATNVISWRDKGQEFFAIVNTEPIGIPSELTVKGMHGTLATVGGLTKVMAIPARFLRTMVTRSPVYAARQVFRNPQ